MCAVVDARCTVARVPAAGRDRRAMDTWSTQRHAALCAHTMQVQLRAPIAVKVAREALGVNRGTSPLTLQRQVG